MFVCVFGQTCPLQADRFSRNSQLHKNLATKEETKMKGTFLDPKQIPRTTGAANALFRAIATILPIATLAHHFPTEFEDDKATAKDMIDTVDEATSLIGRRLSTKNKSAANRWTIVKIDQRLSEICQHNAGTNLAYTQLKIASSHTGYDDIDSKYVAIENRLCQLETPIPNAEPYSGAMHELLGKIYGLVVWTLDQSLEYPSSETEYTVLGDIIIFAHIALSICTDCCAYDDKISFMAWTSALRKLNAWATELVRFAKSYTWDGIAEMDLPCQIINLNQTCYKQVYHEENIPLAAACNG